MSRLATFMPEVVSADYEMPIMGNEREMLQVTVARIEERQKDLLDKLKELTSLLHEIDTRVVAVEEFKWKIIGIAIAVGASASVVSKVLMAKL